ncbi:MAG TPA: glycosyltransferase family 2 protein [Pyrinomonadaceae bacterium]|jgi:glycosyltransferase involved in cell wall biosynthesis
MFYLKFATIINVKISAVIIAFNEEANIPGAIESLNWADEIIVVDSESSDRTREIAEGLGAKIIIQKWLGFSRQKQFAVDSASNDWIFSLDADERVSDELKREITRIKDSSENEIADGFRISRLTYYMNLPIRHSGWYPDWQLRFYNRKKGVWSDALIHESVRMSKNSRIEKLKADILHFSVEDAAHHQRMIGERYAPLAAAQMFERGQKTSVFKVCSTGFTTFFRTYFLKAGFLDGFAGFCIARFAAHHAFLKHLLLWEIQNKAKDQK